jgi:hypothetical protein
MMSNPTCSERIAEQMQSRNETLEEIYDKMNDYDDDEKSAEGSDEYAYLPLEITSYKVIKIVFSTGGPSDWLEIKLDYDDEVSKVSYHFQDWFDHAEMEVKKNTYLWQYAEEHAELQKINN